MSAATHSIAHPAVADHHGDDHGHGHGNDYANAWRNNRLGLWLFFLSEAFLFGGLLATRFYLWGNHRPDLDQVVGFIVTIVLLISSFSMNMAETAIEHDDRRTFMVGLIITAVLGYTAYVYLPTGGPNHPCR